MRIGDCLFLHWEEKNPRDELLMANPRNSSCPKFMNSRQSDYNMHTNLPCV
jgi:hypothetical protein